MAGGSCVSSFGFSGTIAHAALNKGPISEVAAFSFHGRLALRRKRFGWGVPSAEGAEVCQPLGGGVPSWKPALGSLRAASQSELLWEHSFAPHELEFFRGHRVGYVPLLPGTCYIEFVRVVVVAVHGLQLYSLDDVAFHNIMFLDDDANLYGTPLVRLKLDQST
eukprot:6874313-Prymnesium_polylepis.1